MFLYEEKTSTTRTVKEDEDGDVTETRLETWAEVWAHIKPGQTPDIKADLTSWLQIGTRWGNYVTFSLSLDEMKKLSETFAQFYATMVEENFKLEQERKKHTP